MRCPNCDNDGSKVIAFGLPMNFCQECYSLWGIFSYVYSFFVAPLEGMINGHFSFAIYEGSYWKALWTWMKG